MTEYTAKWKLKAAIGEEDSWGVAAAVSKLIPLTAHSIQHIRQDLPYFPVTADGLEDEPSESFFDTTGSFNTCYDSNNIDLLLKALTGTQLSQGGTDPELFYCADASIIPPPLTYVASRFRTKTGGALPLLEYPGLTIMGATFTGNAGKPVDIKWDVAAKKLSEVSPDAGDLINTSDAGWEYEYARHTLLFQQCYRLQLTIDSVDTIFDISGFVVNVINDYTNTNGVGDGWYGSRPTRTGFAANASFTIPNVSDDSRFDNVYDAFANKKPITLRCHFLDSGGLTVGGFFSETCYINMPIVESDIDFTIRIRFVKSLTEAGKFSPLVISAKSISQR